MLLLVLLLGCSSPSTRGVYRSGPNAIVEGRFKGPVKVWGPEGTVERLASEGPGGTTLLGQAGPLWRVDRDVPAPPKAPVVPATTVESAGFRMKEVLGTGATGAADPAKAGGVYVRSVIKWRRAFAPPIYLVAATVDTVGAGRRGGPTDVREGANCEAAVAVMDARGERLISAVRLENATRTCAVPMLVPPVDLDGDGRLDLLAYGQNGNRGFRTWFVLYEDGTLVKGADEAWMGIP